MTDFHKISEGILGEETTEKTNTELFLSLVGQYFPEAIKDGEVDFTALKEEMGEFAEVSSEHYDFTWAGKQAAKKEAMSDIYGRTLKYKPQDSLNPDTTENIYIEGDNLEALKLLRRNYHGKIKMIYIDPPYNTGSDFVYHDDFSMTEEELAEKSGDVVDGVRYQKNNKDGSRYHTNWLNMMYPRLKIARDLLSDDGVIFISIDDNEVENLKKICNEVFGNENFIAQVNIVTGANQSGEGVLIQKNVEYCVVYSKLISIAKIFRVDKTEESYRNLNDAPTPFETRLDMGYTIYYNESTNDMIPKFDYDKSKVYTNDVSLVYFDDIELIQHGYTPIRPGIRNGKLHRWRWGIDTFIERKNEIKIFKSNNNYVPKFLQSGFNAPKNIWNYTVGTIELKKLFDNIPIFDYAKNTKLLNYITSIGSDKDSIILDFFSGSATTAHAVMQLNAEDGGNRKFIMVQLPEVCNEKSEAAKAGYRTICEIGKERIRRAAKKIHEDNPDAQFDDGFKVFEVADTNIRWNTADDEEIQRLDETDYGNDKERIDFTKGYTDIDVVYEIMLRQFDIPLSTPIEKLPQVSDRTYIFADAVVVCLEPEITTELIEKLAAIEPTPAKFVLRDSAFNDDIQLKDVSFRRLSALIKNHQTEEERKSKYNNYTVEFI